MKFVSIALRGLLVASTLAAFGLPTRAQPTGQVRQGLVSGAEVSDEIQQKMGLVSISGCSGVLIRQNWILTAAHCVDDPAGNGFVTVPNDSITVTLRGTGRNPERRKSVQIVTFRPNDVALIRVQTPFSGNAFANREIYIGPLKNLTIRFFGRGINQFAQGGMTAQQDGKYRDGFFNVDKVTPTTYTFSSRNGVSGAGGDSGGPSFAKGRGSSEFGAADQIVGVHSLCETECAEGKECGNDAPDPWDWVTATPTCTDALIAPLWPQISKLIEPSFPTEQFTSNADPGIDSNILYGVQQDGQLMWHRHIIDRRGGSVRHSFQPVRKVGDGWKAGFQGAYPAGANAIYSLDDAGNLRWQWHTGVFEGQYTWNPNTSTVMTGWRNLQILPMDNGVVYTFSKSGTQGILRWHRHLNYLNGQGGADGWDKPKDVHQGFNRYATVFSGGNGVIYAVSLDGRLFWYRHKEYLRPMPLPSSLPPNLPAKLAETLKAQWPRSWDGPVKVGDGWGITSKIFSPGGGHIYLITPEGDLMYYRHIGYMDGSYNWDEKLQGKIASGWNGYASAFARIITSDPQPQGPK